MSDGFKTQLGVRVPPPVKRAAIGKAALTGESLNAYIERLIVDDAGPLPPDTPENQLTILEQEQRAEAQARLAVPEPRTFNPHCQNGTQHWKYGPLNSCPYCGGETYPPTHQQEEQ